MEIAESESGIQGEILKSNHKIAESEEEVSTDDSSNKNHASNILYDTQYEIEESEGGEEDLHKRFDDCKKNPGHKQFIPVNDFNISHLPDGYRHKELFEYIKAVADLTVRVCVEMVSIERPEFFPNNDQKYPYYYKRGSDVMRLGTGTVWVVRNWPEEFIKKCKKGTCKCHKCQHSDKPSKRWGEVFVYTARHVVFDEIEARHTTCRLFYDRQDSPLVTLKVLRMDDANIEEDWCRLECVTCDVNLLDKLDKMSKRWCMPCDKINEKYESARDKDKLTFIVSHPHGCPKQISVGHWITRQMKKQLEKFDLTYYTYTTCTCPGSSGANVHILGYDCLRNFVRQLHSGVNSEGINVSGTSRYVRLHVKNGVL